MKSHAVRFSPAYLFITLGIVFGDIGTSPLYVFTAITRGEDFSEELILGSMSCIFWTLLLIATIKYIYLALNADNHGEGGIFALYALLRRSKAKWIIYPALIGCATLISDGFITPAISISSAVEGLNGIFPSLPTLPIVSAIIVALFLFQQFGTKVIGRFFGPIMLTWFLTLGAMGLSLIVQNPGVLKALNPFYAVHFVLTYPGGLWVLGAVFLCTTGAEALYSDLGHCGKVNIRMSWIFVLSMLLLNYFGQAAFCLSLTDGQKVESVFYSAVPYTFLPFAIGIATLATIIASQALITGVFTLVNEAIKLKLWTSLKVKYPSTHKGQVYIPYINYFLMFGCLAVIFLFKKSANMEAAYGLAITIDMLMTTVLLGYLLLHRKKRNQFVYVLLIALFALVEGTFLVSNFGKLTHGGWFTLLLASILFILLFFFYKTRQLRQRFTEYVAFEKIAPILRDVIQDDALPLEATNLVFPTRSNNPTLIDSTIVYSLFNKRPKRAQIYWLLHVAIADYPWGINYRVRTLIPHRCFFITLELGFKEPHQIEYLMKKIHEEMVESGEVSGESAFESIRKHHRPPDFKFVLLNSRVSNDNQLSAFDLLAIRIYRFIKSIGMSTFEDFGLDRTNVVEEYIPINVAETIELKIHRVHPKH